MTDEPNDVRIRAPATPGRASPERVADPREPAARSREPIRSEALLAGASEVQIVHRGTLYRLKQTALGKLILTK
jgi:hemin uptake protein HemP